MTYSSLKTKHYLFYFFLIVLSGMVVFLLDTDIPISKYKNWKKPSQLYFHGVVRNLTQRPVQVTEFREIKTIPPGESSIDMDIEDADSLVIDYPTEIDGHIYTSGVFKFCDFGILTITEAPRLHRVLIARRIILCKLFNDFHHYQKIQDAFVTKHKHKIERRL